MGQRRLLARPAPVLVDAEIPAEPHEPGQKTRRQVELEERAKNPQENLLRQLPASSRLPGELKGDVVDAPGVPLHQELPGDLVTLEAANHQFVSVAAKDSALPRWPS